MLGKTKVTTKTTNKAAAMATARATPEAKARPQNRKEDHDGVDIVDNQEPYQKLPLYEPGAERKMWPFALGQGNCLRIGSDRSGLDSFMYALKELGLNEDQVKLQSSNTSTSL